MVDKDVQKEEEEDSKWLPFYRPYTKEEKRKLVANIKQVSLETVFKNHIYKCSGWTRSSFAF